MSLNKKYTWGDFLKEHPEYKEKKIKRTSKEGQKAFEAAFKQQAKDYLKNRLEKIDKEQENVEKVRKELSKVIKAAKEAYQKRSLQPRIGAVESKIAHLDKERERAKSLQKSL
jgi:hypothetical protein